MLHDATRRLREVEQYVEDMLVAIYPGWRPRHPRARGWRFSSPDAIDVYEAPDPVDSAEAAARLHRAGFYRVTAHSHDHRAACRCRSHLPAQRRTPVPGDGIHASGTIDVVDEPGPGKGPASVESPRRASMGDGEPPDGSSSESSGESSGESPGEPSDGSPDERGDD